MKQNMLICLRTGARNRWFLLVVALLILLQGARPALAHTRAEVGPYVVVVGWLIEPPIVGERNAVTVEISENDAPVPGVEAGLDAEVLFGTATYRANLIPTATPGLYTVELLPTVRGQYEIRLFGTIGDTTVDETLEPEEIFPASRIQFPEAAPTTRELERSFELELAALADQLRTARLLGIGGLVTGLLGIIGAVISAARSRRR